MARLRDLQSNWTSGELDPRLLGQVDLKHYLAGAAAMRNVLVMPQGGFTQRPGLRYLDEVLPELTQYSLSGATITAPNGGTVANLTDGDEATTLLTTVNIGTINPYVVFHVDLGAAVDLQFIDVMRFRTQSATNVPGEWALQVSTDNVAWTTLGEPFQQADSTARDRRREIGGSYRYLRFARVGTTDMGTNKALVGELQVWTRAATLSPAVLVPHNFSTFQRFLMLFTDRNMRVYFNQAVIADVPTPYESADLFTDTELGISTINWTNLDDTLLVFHEQHRPRRFQRQGQNYEWDPKDWVLNNLPTYNFGSGAEPVISDARGWPRCGTFFQGRLWMAGSTSRPQTFWASRSGDFEDFDTSTAGDDYGIEGSADVDEVSAFFNIYAGRHLQFFASSAEFYIPISDTEGVTPGNAVLRRTTQIGAKRGVRVFEVEGATFFLSTTGTSLREFLFVDTEQAYAAAPISKLASHLIIDPVGMAYRKALGLEKADYVWIVNNDGTLTAFCTLRSENVNAMTLQLTDGSFLATAISRDESYFVVERNINGTARRFLEIFDDALLVDAGVSGTGVASGASGLDHLEGEEVQLVLDDMPEGMATVSGGAVTFPRDSREKWQVGLAWPFVDPAGVYRAWVKSPAIEGALPDGTQVGTRKRIVSITNRLHETRGLVVNGKRLQFDKVGDELLDQTTPLFTGDKVLRGILGNGLQAQFEIGITEPAQFTVLATSYRVAV